MSTVRKEIIPHLGGIRGCAILLILLFHIGITGDTSPLTLPGGYLGVEIFLVISGFLLALGFAKKEESCIDFARKKLLRIMYPVSMMLLLTILVCLFCMDYEDLLNTGTNAIWSAFAANNIQLSKSGAEYFSSDSTWNPLLHTWYISITVQLYILFYAGYRLMRRWNKWVRYAVLLLILLFSFFYAQCHEWRAELVKLLGLPVWMGNADSMYYSTIGRIWEPLAGAAVLLLPACNKKWLSSLLSLIAILGIGACVWLQPAQAMLYVVLATVIIIRYGGDHVVSSLYNNVVTRCIGLISFSLYLVHMPLIVCHKAFTFDPLGWWSVAGILVGSVVLGWLFWYLVERRKVSLYVLAGVWVLTLAAAYTLISTDGLKNYWNKESNGITLPSYDKLREEHDAAMLEEFNKKLIWHYGSWVTQTGAKVSKSKRMRYMHRVGSKKTKPFFVVMGDSHAGHYMSGLDRLGRQHSFSGVGLTTIVIPFWDRAQLETTKDYFFTKEKAEAIWHWLKKHPEITHVIIGQTWVRASSLNLDWNLKKVPAKVESNLPMLREFCQQLKAIGKKVIVIGPEPRFAERTPMRYFRYLKRNNLSSIDKPYPKCVCTERQYQNQFGEVIKYMDQMHKDDVCTVIYPHKYLFRNGIVGMEEKGRIIFRDHHHFSVKGAEIITQRMWPELAKALGLSEKLEPEK